VPLWTLYGLTQATRRTILLSVSVLPESFFPAPNGCLFLPGMPAEHRARLHPEPGNAVFKICSSDPASARSHSEWHWGLSASVLVSWMKYLGWAPEQEWRRPFRGNWEWWQGVFHPDPAARLQQAIAGPYVQISLDEFVERVKAPPPANAPKPNWRKVTSVDVFGNVAVAKLENDFPAMSLVDYLTLLKVDGEWKIVNKAFHRTDNFRDGALAVVNLGEDADTTGAVYGQIAGAFYGAEGIPSEWREKLAMRDLIEQRAAELHAMGLGERPV
jgi:hypothetical protein